MSNKVRLPKEKVNFFDGQNITESDLDTEQIYHESMASEIVTDFHGSGVLNLEPFSERILFDTRQPGKYNNQENDSKLIIENGRYDGRGIYLDRQPSDSVYGNRIVFEMVDVNILGKNRPKILIVGRTFNGVNSSGILNYELIEFEHNSSQLSKFYYQEIIAIFLNNFSGGLGKNEFSPMVESLDLISKTNGYLLVKEAEPLKVFSQPLMIEQTLSPNLELSNFISSSIHNDLKTEIALALDAASSLSDLYIEYESKEQVSFEKNGSTAKAFGQKFLSKSNNLQRIDLVLSVERDDSQPPGEEFDWTGDLVLGIHEISGKAKTQYDPIPNDLMDFDPELNPLIEVSFSQEDLEAFGYKLTDKPQIVSFNFANTLIANPNIEPSIEKDKYYALILSRRGDNRTGTILLEKGHDIVRRKQDLGLDLSIVEQFAKQESRYVEFDPIRGKYLDDPSSSLWFRIYSNDIEITSGTAYSDNGKSISIPKTVKYIGGNEISYFENHIPLLNAANSEPNYVILNYVQKFTDGGTHPLTGNFVFTRIQDAAAGSVVDSDGLNKISKDTQPLVLAKIIDNNIRDASDLEGELSMPGQIETDRIFFINPSPNLVSSNLIGRVISPDLDCTCNARYRIADVLCREVYAGDLNDNQVLDSEDISLLLEIAGNTINSRTTERSILGGELSLLDFVKSDLNQDGTVDGFDIDLLENAIDGNIEFTISQKFKVLELVLENILEEDDYPLISTDQNLTGQTSSNTNIITVTVQSKNEALAIRPGDIITIPDDSLDAGEYEIITKTIEADGVTLSFEVSSTNNDVVIFNGSSNFNVTIRSGTRVNTFADNFNLLNIPFKSTNYQISYMNFPFSPRFIDVCDLRRFVSTSFIEEQSTNECQECDSSGCENHSLCAPVYKNQHYFAGDIYLPNGQILTEPGVPYAGDYEYVNVLVPLPPGTISDCSVDLYRTFVALDQNCKTAAGFPAMRYSDGTYVGCNDSGSVTDLSLNRVKFSHAIASLYVDAFVDGYAVDGYADAEISSNNKEAIFEQFIDFSYHTFGDWVEDPFNEAALGNIQHLAGPNEPAIFNITTINSLDPKYLKISPPIGAQFFNGDFIVDIKAMRSAWPTMTSGLIEAHSSYEILNNDGSSAILKLGWKRVGTGTTKIVFSGIIRDSFNTIINSFEYLEDAPDLVGEEVLFRLRRINDAVFAYYLIPDKIGDLESHLGHYIRLGKNLEIQPGDGAVTMSYEVRQSNSPDSGYNFIVNLKDVILRSQYSVDTPDEVLIGRDANTNQISRLTCNFPLNLTSKTNIVKASLKMSARSASVANDTFNIIPLGILNADNLGKIHNIPETQESSYIASFSPGSIANQEEIEVDITGSIFGLLSSPGHLPGFLKGFIIEPASNANSSFSISSDLVLNILYEDITTGVVFQVGVSVDPKTGIATFNTKNILYDSMIEENRTVINFGVHLKKSGFKNNDIQMSINDLTRIGLGTCRDESALSDDNNQCYFIVGTLSGSTGMFVEGPWPCSFHLP